MRHISLVICLLLFIQANVISQSCLPEGIFITTQAEIDSFPINYPNCSEIEGDLVIVSAFVNDLSALSVLTSIGGALDINTNVSSLSGLENITYVGGLYLLTPFIPNLEPLVNLTSIEGTLMITSSSLHDLSGLDNVTHIGGNVWIDNNFYLENLSGLENLTSINGHLYIYHNTWLTSLDGLNNVTSVAWSVDITHVESLINLHGLNSLTSIGGHLYISTEHNFTNPSSLIDFSGLENLTHIGGTLQILKNDALLSLTGLESLDSIGGKLEVFRNDALVNLSGLENITAIGGHIAVENNATLTNLSGLDNIYPSSITGIRIVQNSSLSSCEAESICEYLVSPNSDVVINNNAPGCNSQEEVEDACMVSVENVNREYDISIFPNPANNQLTISSKVGTIEEVIIYNQTGQMVLNQIPGNNTIDISHLHPGVYFVEVVIGQSRIREKLIIK